MAHPRELAVPWQLQRGRAPRGHHEVTSNTMTILTVPVRPARHQLKGKRLVAYSLRCALVHDTSEPLPHLSPLHLRLAHLYLLSYLASHHHPLFFSCPPSFLPSAPLYPLLGASVVFPYPLQMLPTQSMKLFCHSVPHRVCSLTIRIAPESPQSSSKR